MPGQVLVPTSITVTVEGTPLKIADAKLEFTFSNNSTLHRSIIAGKGTETYALQKGTSVSIGEEIEFIIVVDPNQASAPTIRTLREQMKPKGNEDNKSTDKNILIHIEAADGEKICDISFKGYIIAIIDITQKDDHVRRYRVIFIISDSSSLTL